VLEPAWRGLKARVPIAVAMALDASVKPEVKANR
jgi:hypothetical protein